MMYYCVHELQSLVFGEGDLVVIFVLADFRQRS